MIVFLQFFELGKNPACWKAYLRKYQLCTDTLRVLNQYCTDTILIIHEHRIQQHSYEIIYEYFINTVQAAHHRNTQIKWYVYHTDAS